MLAVLKLTIGQASVSEHVSQGCVRCWHIVSLKGELSISNRWIYLSCMQLFVCRPCQPVNHASLSGCTFLEGVYCIVHRGRNILDWYLENVGLPHAMEVQCNWYKNARVQHTCHSYIIRTCYMPFYDNAGYKEFWTKGEMSFVCKQLWSFLVFSHCTKLIKYVTSIDLFIVRWTNIQSQLCKYASHQFRFIDFISSNLIHLSPCVWSPQTNTRSTEIYSVKIPGIFHVNASANKFLRFVSI